MTNESARSLEDLADDLGASPEFKVLRRARIKAGINTTREAVRTGIVVDATTTGYDPAVHDVTNLTALPFTYTGHGLVLTSETPFHLAREIPSPPTSRSRTSARSIQPDAGDAVEANALDQAIGQASLVIAFDAARVRPFLEPLCERFEEVAWACAQTQAPWSKEGFRAARFESLLLQHGLFCNPNSPKERCEAILALLARPLPTSGVPALAPLLAKARQITFRIWAIGAPSATRDLLSSHGYGWNSGADGRARSWFKEVAPDAIEAEQAFLTSFWFDGAIDPKVETVDALKRFSSRA